MTSDAPGKLEPNDTTRCKCPEKYPVCEKCAYDEGYADGSRLPSAARGEVLWSGYAIIMRDVDYMTPGFSGPRVFAAKRVTHGKEACVPVHLVRASTAPGETVAGWLWKEADDCMCYGAVVLDGKAPCDWAVDHPEDITAAAPPAWHENDPERGQWVRVTIRKEER